EFNSVLQRGMRAPTSQADALCWLTHLVGDVHQPLHCTTVIKPLPNYTPPETGDRGGNGFHLKGLPNNLHAYWDDQIDMEHAADPHHVPELTDPEIGQHAHAIEQAFPLASFNGQEKMLDPGVWAKESFALSGPAYQNAMPGETPSAAYAMNAKSTAERRIALAGYRLAE